MGDVPPMIRTTSFAEFDAVLRKIHAKLDARQVHALFLGALASTNSVLWPDQLIQQIFGDEPRLGDSIEDANASLEVIVGYWVTLVTECVRTGRVRLAPCELPAKPTGAELRDVAKRRCDEVRWFFHGMGAGCDDPSEFGSDGERYFAEIARCSAALNMCAEHLDSEDRADEKLLEVVGRRLPELVGTIELLIAGVMCLSDELGRG